MKNTIIGLCAALVLYGAQTFGCGHEECVEFTKGGTINGEPVWTKVYRKQCTQSFSGNKNRGFGAIPEMDEKVPPLSQNNNQKLLLDLQRESQETNPDKDFLNIISAIKNFEDNNQKLLFHLQCESLETNLQLVA